MSVIVYYNTFMLFFYFYAILVNTTVKHLEESKPSLPVTDGKFFW